MALALDAGRGSRSLRPVWVRQQPSESTSALTALILMLILASVTVAVLVDQSISFSEPWLSFLNVAPHRNARPAEGTAPPVAASPAEATVTAPAEATETGSAAPVESVKPEDAAPHTLAVGGRARVVNTQGLGVVLHSAPSKESRRPAGLLEGTSVTVVELAGQDWARVQSDTRQDGWVPSAFLAPAE